MLVYQRVDDRMGWIMLDILQPNKMVPSGTLTARAGESGESFARLSESAG